jgi:hypothetical protein
MERLLQDRVVQAIGASVLLCITIFALTIGYQRWRFVQQAYAEAVRFGYTEENFLVAEEHCGDPWILFIPPPTCRLTIYFTTDMTSEQLTQFMIDEHYFRSFPNSGSPVGADTIIRDINTYGGKKVTVNGSDGTVSSLPMSNVVRWRFSDRNHMDVKYWPINPRLTYAIDGKIFRKNVIGVGVRR